MIILLFDSPVSVKDQARIRIIYFNVIYIFSFSFWQKGQDGGIDAEKEDSALKAQVQCM